MSQCIYCLKNDGCTTFHSREHVIPQCLGRFEPLNPTIKGDIVCDECNKLFSPLEVNFTEDTYEGVYSQRLKLRERGSVTIRGKQFKIDRLSGFGDGFLKEMFPFLEPRDGKIVPVPKNQIKLNRFREGYRIFLPETLDAVVRGSKEFKKLSADMQKLSQKDMAIFAENHDEVKKIITLLHEYGVKYKEKASHYQKIEAGQQIFVEEEYKCSINIDIARILAKIAFNYFAYCAIQSGKPDILYQSNFDKIRTFIHDGTIGKVKEIIPSISEEPILKEERDQKKRLIAHLINFLPENGKIFVRMTFFGLPAIYKIELGMIPDELVTQNFGCGHAFDPFAHRVDNLSQTPALGVSREEVKDSFGLFKRF